MVSDLSTRAADDKQSEIDLRMAALRAQEAVAADPASENAAIDLFEAVGRSARAATAISGGARTPPPDVARAAYLLKSGQDEEAEVLLRRYLVAVPNDPDAMLLMADIAMRCGFPENTDKILRRSVELHPGRPDNLLAFAKFLHHRARELDKVELVDDALFHLDQLLAAEPDHEAGLRYKAALLSQVRRLEESKEVFERLLKAHPHHAQTWADYAHLLKTLGHFGQAVAGFRTALALDPANGAIWTLMSDMKLARFFSSDIDRLKGALNQPQDVRDQIGLRFALAAAYHHAKDYEKAFAQLTAGSALRLQDQPHDAGGFDRGIVTAIDTYTTEFFAAREGCGHFAPDPIFVVGLPRSGSTLVEQILASHPSIEGTAELLAVQKIEHELLADSTGDLTLDELVAQLPFDRFARLGERYLELTRFHRRTDRPRFTDKYPGNWRQTGLIRAMLPNAKIIDIRRNPMDCCFSNYSQHFATGVNYSYSLSELAEQYRQYVRLMRHFDEVLPGKVHRIIYDDLIENTEAEVRRLLAFLGLPYDERCLRFFETERAVHTPSSEQVRQPINRSGIGKWRLYEPWLGELSDELGQTVEDWR
jgi:tetratricopeptide (TPR) repeat protein